MVTQARQWNLMRDRSGGEQRVTNIELFFDLVYVFAVTQLSHFLLHHRTVTGALQAALLMVMVWLLWVYTTWVTNWLDPERLGVRLLLLALMLVSLVMAAALPEAFDGEGLAVGCCYALMQIGRSAFTVVALPGETLQRNFERILAWCCASGALAVAGGLSSGDARWILWLAAVATDLLGGIVGFYTPGLGRSSSGDWDIAGRSLRRAVPGLHPDRPGRVHRHHRRHVRRPAGHRPRRQCRRDRRVRRRVRRQRRAVVAVLRPQRGRRSAPHRRVG